MMHAFLPRGYEGVLHKGASCIPLPKAKKSDNLDPWRWFGESLETSPLGDDIS